MAPSLKNSESPSGIIDSLRLLDRQWQRLLRPDKRRLLVNSRTAMNYATLAPIIERLRSDSRIEVYFTASENPAKAESIYSEVRKPFHLVSPFAAAFTKFGDFSDHY